MDTNILIFPAERGKAPLVRKLPTLANKALRQALAANVWAIRRLTLRTARNAGVPYAALLRLRRINPDQFSRVIRLLSAHQTTTFKQSLKYQVIGWLEMPADARYALPLTERQACFVPKSKFIP